MRQFGMISRIKKMRGSLPLGVDNSSSPVFVVGCGRSGTTLLRLILNKHPHLAMFGESSAFFRLGRYGSLQNRGSLRRFVRDWNFAFASQTPYSGILDSHELRSKLCKVHSHADAISTIMWEFAAREKKKNWGEKTPAHVHKADTILRAYPKAKIIHITRDPRAVVRSALLSFTSGPFLLRDAYNIAMYWVKCERTIERVQQSHPHQVKLIKYEDLVSNPEATIVEICDFVGIDYDAGMLDTASSASRYAPREGGSGGEVIKIHQGLLTNINSNALLKWRDDLSDEIIAAVQLASRAWLLKRNYKVEAVKYPSLLRIKILEGLWCTSEASRFCREISRSTYWRARVLAGH
jgi:hypothetical protein